MFPNQKSQRQTKSMKSQMKKILPKRQNRKNSKEKLIKDRFQNGRDQVLTPFIFKINTQMKLAQMVYFRYSSLMSLIKEIKRFILLTVFHILIQCFNSI